MSYQLGGNESGLKAFGEFKRQDLLAEAGRDRLSKDAGPRGRRNAAALAPLAIAFALLALAALALF